MTASAPGRAASTGTLCGATAVGGADEPPAAATEARARTDTTGGPTSGGSGQLHWRPITAEPAAGRHHPCGLTAAGAHGDERAPKLRQNGGVPRVCRSLDGEHNPDRARCRVVPRGEGSEFEDPVEPLLGRCLGIEVPRHAAPPHWKCKRIMLPAERRRVSGSGRYHGSSYQPGFATDEG